MAIHYRAEQRVNPQDPKGPRKFYIIRKSIGRIGRDELIESAVKNTTLSRQEASAAIDFIFEEIPRGLLLGHTVLLGDLGFFKTSIRSEGSDTIEEATSEKVKEVKVHFVFGKKIRKLIRNAPLQKDDTKRRRASTNKYDLHQRTKEEIKQEAFDEFLNRCREAGMDMEAVKQTLVGNNTPTGQEER